MKLSQTSILVLDDDKDVLTAVRLLLKGIVREVVTESNPELLMHRLSQQSFDLLLLDMNFMSPINTGNEGLFWLREVKQKFPQIAVVMITAYADIDLAVRSLKEGASDFVVKPWHNEQLVQTLKDALQQKGAPKSKPKTSFLQQDSQKIIGESPVMQTLFMQIEKVAPSDANVLILGENGTGKDLIAKALHQKSFRKEKPFVKVDVGALTETLFESELFGYKKGAFTDAREDRKGLIETANGGTLFLDEIGNIPLRQQAKLLTVLQNREIIPLGSNTAIPIDIRLITATNLPISELANEQHFRKDLIYRINTVELTIPPLRKRSGDIKLLSEYFLKIYEKKYLKPSMSFAKNALEKLIAYPFPGNVRELQYTIERAVIMSDNPMIDSGDIIFSLIEDVQEKQALPDSYNLEEIEKQTILNVLEKHAGNISRAANELGLTRAALYRRMSKYGI